MEPAYETEGGAPAVCDKLTELCDGVLTVVLGPEPEKSVLSVLELGTATDRCAVRTVEGVAVTGKAGGVPVGRAVEAPAVPGCVATMPGDIMCMG